MGEEQLRAKEPANPAEGETVRKTFVDKAYEAFVKASKEVATVEGRKIDLIELLMLGNIAKEAFQKSDSIKHFLEREDVQKALEQLDVMMPFMQMLADDFPDDSPLWDFPMHIMTHSVQAYIDLKKLQGAGEDTTEAQRKPFLAFIKAYVDECQAIEKVDPKDLYTSNVHGRILTVLSKKGLLQAVGNDEIIAAAEKAKALEGYFFLPNSEINQLVKQTLNSPGNVANVKKGVITVQPSLISQDISITYRGSETMATIELARTKELFKSRVRNGAKIYNFFLQKINEQGGRETTTFLLQELVDNGLYANKDTAYRGLKTVANKMMSMHIEGTRKEYGKEKPKETRYRKAVLLSEVDVSYNACAVILPPIIRCNMKYITILPTWAYTLSENAFMLLDYVYYLARQNAQRITDEGSFKITLEAVRAHLGLPTPAGAGTDPKRLIIDPIEKAVEDIEDGRNGTDVYITPVYNPEYKNVHEYLAGHLEIKLDGNAAVYMGRIAGRRKKKTAEAAKRTEKAKLKPEQDKTKQLQKAEK